MRPRTMRLIFRSAPVAPCLANDLNLSRRADFDLQRILILLKVPRYPDLLPQKKVFRNRGEAETILAGDEHSYPIWVGIIATDVQEGGLALRAPRPVSTDPVSYTH